MQRQCPTGCTPTLLLVASRLAPESRSSEMTMWLPLAHPQWRAVLPVLVCFRLVLALKVIRRRAGSGLTTTNNITSKDTFVQVSEVPK